ncbi:MAG: 2-oxoacid:acceptor oxidoreductase family protein [Synergistales bacterium]|nr:2-oxoacid:acceptor oxidoreductase family protein [Synergistales bacterium]
MYEIRWHGRGGQGGFTVARLLGMAASVFEGQHSLAFPSFGPERRGAPVLGFTRISETRITDRSMVDQCDYVVVLDETLIGPGVLSGLKENAVVLVNTCDPEPYRKMTDRKIVAIDATDLAMEILGRPITNTAMLGALLAVSGLVSLKSAQEAIRSGMKASIAEKNCIIVEKAYSLVKGELINGQA